MFLACLRLVFLIATFLASLNVAAAPRVWTLTDVRFSDGATATGYVGYDDLTAKFVDWNIRVTQGQTSWPLAPFTFVPGNSSVFEFELAGIRELTFFVSVVAPASVQSEDRQLTIGSVGPLGADRVAVSLLTDHHSREQWVSGRGDPSIDTTYEMSRGINAGSLVVTPSPPPIATVQVDEFYNATLDHYFMTADTAEKNDLDAGVHRGWARTGARFNAYAAGSPAGGPINPVCRYYGNPQAGLDSHFYSADLQECADVYFKYGQSVWPLENDNVFQISRPDKASGGCPALTVPVYRLWNQRKDSNHRYTANAVIKAQMLAAGYLAEGYGPDGVAMCALE